MLPEDCLDKLPGHWTPHSVPGNKSWQEIVQPRVVKAVVHIDETLGVGLGILVMEVSWHRISQPVPGY